MLLAILAVATVLRFHDLDRTSLWYDEAVSWSQSNGSFSDLLFSVAADNYPPLHNIVLWLTMPVFGDSEFALRLPSAFLGVFTVWLIYLTGKLLGGRTTGLLAAALLAVSPFHIWYSTEARMYALLAATGLAFLLAALYVLHRPTRSWLLVLSLSGTLFLYSHIYALLGFASVGLVCAAFALTDVVRNKSARGSNAVLACLAMGTSTLAFLPWLIILANRAQSVAEAGFWIAYPDLSFLKNMVFSISGSLALFWILLCLALLCLFKSLVVTSDAIAEASRNRRTVIVCLAYTVGPLGLAYLYSLFVQPILFDRYLIAAWPGLVLLSAAGAKQLLPRIAPIGLFVVALALTFPELKFTLTQKVRPEWREVTQIFLTKRSPGDHLSLYKGFAAPALEYYIRPPERFKAVENVSELKAETSVASAGNRWLLLVHSNRQETEAARQFFGSENLEPVARTFGWGESGLTLLRTTDN